MHRFGWSGCALGLLLLTGCPASSSPPLQTVAQVDLEKYAGLWYEIAKYPVWFQSGCVATTAEYTLRDDGRVTVLNTCREGDVDGPERNIEGTARVPDPADPAKLKVGFFLFFEGNYWIIDLDEDYQWAVVSDPSRQTLWILSRTPTLDAATYTGILDRLALQGFDLDRLVETPQPPGG